MKLSSCIDSRVMIKIMTVSNFQTFFFTICFLAMSYSFLGIRIIVVAQISLKLFVIILLMEYQGVWGRVGGQGWRGAGDGGWRGKVPDHQEYNKTPKVDFQWRQMKRILINCSCCFVIIIVVTFVIFIVVVFVTLMIISFFQRHCKHCIASTLIMI